MGPGNFTLVSLMLIQDQGYALSSDRGGNSKLATSMDKHTKLVLFSHLLFYYESVADGIWFATKHVLNFSCNYLRVSFSENLI